MAIAAANLFTRNVYVEFVKPDATSQEQTRVSKLASLLAKFGAVGFVVGVPTTFVINFQLAAGVWILQTLPAVFLALFWRKLDPRATLVGWAVGTTIGTWLLVENGFKTSSYAFGWGDHLTTLFIGIPALLANLSIAVAGTLVARLVAQPEVAAPPVVGPSL